MAEGEEEEEQEEGETEEGEEVVPYWLFSLTGAQIRLVKSGTVNLR